MARRLVVGAACAVLLVACSSEPDRPSDAAWTPTWEQTRDLVPTAETLVDEGEARCESVLGEVRAAREDLVPTPSEVLDDTVDDWISRVESVMFDCPVDDADDLRDRLHDIDVVTAEIDAGLLADDG